MALAVNHNEIYLLDSRQVWSTHLKKAIQKYTLNKRMSKEEYNAIHPNKPTEADWKNDIVLDTFKEIEVLLYLVEELKKRGEMNGT